MLPFYIIWSAWFISEILINRIFISGNKTKQKKDKGTLAIIWITIMIANSLGFTAAFIYHFPIAHNDLIPQVGLLIMLAGIVFRFAAIRSLGKQFTVDVAIIEDHTLKNDGLYKFIRHPAYLGSLVSFYSCGISLNSWLSLIIIAVPISIVFLYRIHVEETLLLEQFGTDYADYKRFSYRLVPFIY